VQTDVDLPTLTSIHSMKGINQDSTLLRAIASLAQCREREAKYEHLFAAKPLIFSTTF
jgi:hypothetical protein